MRSRVGEMAMFAVSLLILTGSSAFARVEASNQSAVGMWRLDASRSSYGNMPVPKFEQLTIVTDKPDATKWNLKGIMPDGKSYFSSYDGPIDGKDHPMMSKEAGSTVAYTRTASGVQWTVKDKAGVVMETASGQVSPDGKTLTIKGVSQDPKGKSNFVSVFRRVQ